MDHERSAAPAASSQPSVREGLSLDSMPHHLTRQRRLAVDTDATMIAPLPATGNRALSTWLNAIPTAADTIACLSRGLLTQVFGPDRSGSRLSLASLILVAPLARPIQHNARDKYLHIMEELMDTDTQLSSGTTDPETQRVVIKPMLNDIATEIGEDFPVYLMVPRSGDAIATIACPLDPSDEDWSQASQVACMIIGKRLGGLRLRGRELTCAIVNPAMAAADVTVESIQSVRVAGPVVADV
jgi:hypothetical protein